MAYHNWTGLGYTWLFELGCFEDHKILQVMSPKRLTDEPCNIEIPSSPSDKGMAIDAGSDPLAIDVTLNPMQIARSDPRQGQNGHQNFELEAEVVSLRQALLEEQIAGQSRNQELNAHLRHEARLALDYQRNEFRNAAQRHEQVSADATMAAVIKERSDQQVAQRQQLDVYKQTLMGIEAEGSQREYTLQ